MDYHDYANPFLPMPNSELKLLADDINENAPVDPAVLCEGRIMDGRNRCLVCKQLDRETEIIVHEARASGFVS